MVPKATKEKGRMARMPKEKAKTLKARKATKEKEKGKETLKERRETPKAKGKTRAARARQRGKLKALSRPARHVGTAGRLAIWQKIAGGNQPSRKSRLCKTISQPLRVVPAAIPLGLT